MDSLNAAQVHAATTIDGPVVIVAGPGTGKTKTLVERVRHMVEQSVPPHKILALTFTKKAADEMRARLGDARVRIVTFHALCFELLTQKSNATPELITEPARLTILRSLTKSTSLTGLSVRDVALRVSRAKNMAGTDDAIRPVLAAYTAELTARGLHDFDDILLHTRDFLLADAVWRAHNQQRFTHIMIDEFQDTNALQYELLQLLRGTDNLCVIGDPLQSIYGFRGADGDIFGRFLADFPHAKQMGLSVNYRSAPEVVAAANAIYPDSPALLAHNTRPGHAQTVEVLNEYSEAAWVLGQIEQAIGGSDLQKAVSTDRRSDHQSLRDFAVLYRTRSAARVLQKILIDSGIPVQIVGDGSPYEAPQVQAIVQLLARLVDPGRTVVIKNMRPTQIAALVAALDVNEKPLMLTEKLIAACGFTPDAALHQLCSTLMQFGTVVEAVAYIDGIAAHGFYDPRADAVTLLTIHAAKGLEFTHVFLVAAEDGALPSAKGERAEERRLFYVAVTRAKDQLDILHARSRGGQKVVMSPFAAAIPANILPRISDAALANDQRRAAKRHAKRAQSSLF